MEGVAEVLDEALRARLAGNLAGFEVREIDDPALRLAAVAAVITTDISGQPALIVTRRPARMGRHAGQYALPGGKVDAGETAQDAALRELDEELGLRLDAGCVMGTARRLSNTIGVSDRAIRCLGWPGLPAGAGAGRS